MFAERPTIQRLCGDRLHLQHGPIDIVLKACGEAASLARAYDAAAERFQSVLGELVGELGELRRPMAERPQVSGSVALRMVMACTPFTGIFITPMAAVAGSVADELMAAMTSAASLRRAFVNNGGDIAVHLAAGESMEIGIAGDLGQGAIPAMNGRIALRSDLGIGGIATSGRGGRSFSLGIADSVTVLAANAAAADAAATLIANAVNIDSPAVSRAPAAALDPDSDLGQRLVTVDVGPLTAVEILAALENARLTVEDYRRAGLIAAAALTLKGETLTVGEGLARDRLLARGRNRLMTVKLRKIALYTEEVRHDGGPALTAPVRKGWAACVIENPFAGRYVEDIAWLMDELKPLGLECSTRLVAALGGDVKAIQAYGKAALVGVDGEMEHGALWHAPGGYAMRELMGQALAIVPSTHKVGPMGSPIDVPLHHKDAAYVRSHFNTMTVVIPDAPRANEIVFVLTMSTGARPHARVGGLDVSHIAKWDGQR